MMKLVYLCIVLFALSAYGAEEPEIASAKVESCPSCSLNRLPEVKSFIYEDLPKYGLEFKRIHGAPPELVLFDSSDEEVKRLPLSKLSRKECNELLESYGFTKSEKSIPDEKNEF